jgi:hypothetical protein
MRFKLWQSNDMQEHLAIIKAKSYEQALDLALETLGYHLTVVRSKNEDDTNDNPKG